MRVSRRDSLLLVVVPTAFLVSLLVYNNTNHDLHDRSTFLIWLVVTVLAVAQIGLGTMLLVRFARQKSTSSSSPTAEDERSGQQDHNDIGAGS